MGICPTRAAQASEPVRTIVLDSALRQEPIEPWELKDDVEPAEFRSYPHARVGVGHTLYTLVHAAYAHHRPLHLFPEDFLLAVDAIVSHTVDADPEGFRRLFVTHAGKKELVLQSHGGEAWAARIHGLVALARANVVDASFADHMACDFSTSTDADRVASATFVLDTVKHYFDFKIEVSCGIPAVHLHGTVEDYERLVAKTRALGRFLGVAYFETNLVPIFEGLVHQRRGRGGREFWAQMISRTPGGYSYTWNGWIMALYPTVWKPAEGPVAFRVSNNNAGELTKCISRVPFTLSENGIERKMRIRGGPMGIQEEPDGSLRVVRGYRIEIRDDEKDAREDLHRELTGEFAAYNRKPGFKAKLDEYNRRKERLTTYRTTFERALCAEVEVSMIDEFLEKDLDRAADAEFFHVHAQVRIWCDKTRETDVTARMARSPFRCIIINE